MRYLPYRLGVGAMLLNKKGLVFVGRRSSPQGSEAWQMPQGGIDDGESPEAAVRRELREETGVESAEIIAETPGWLSYRLPAELAATLWGGRFAGQRQKWYLMRFTGDDGEININGEHPEFCMWKWERPAGLPSLIVSFKRTLYMEALAAFKAHLS
ncbi:MAG: RNA pyrophosphohydrolase [Rickettsiales bacterium]